MASARARSLMCGDKSNCVPTLFVAGMSASSAPVPPGLPKHDILPVAKSTDGMVRSPRKVSMSTGGNDHEHRTVLDSRLTVRHRSSFQRPDDRAKARADHSGSGTGDSAD